MRELICIPLNFFFRRPNNLNLSAAKLVFHTCITYGYICDMSLISIDGQLLFISNTLQAFQVFSSSTVLVALAS